MRSLVVAGTVNSGAECVFIGKLNSQYCEFGREKFQKELKIFVKNIRLLFEIDLHG